MNVVIRNPDEYTVLAAPTLALTPYRAQCAPARCAETALTPHPLSRCAGEGSTVPRGAKILQSSGIGIRSRSLRDCRLRVRRTRFKR